MFKGEESKKIHQQRKFPNGISGSLFCAGCTPRCPILLAVLTERVKLHKMARICDV